MKANGGEGGVNFEVRAQTRRLSRKRIFAYKGGEGIKFVKFLRTCYVDAVVSS